MDTVLITGANRGIGLALTRKFLSAEYQVIACCRNPNAATALNTLAVSASVTVHSLDVSDEQSVSALHQVLGRQPVDILINNAGVYGGDNQAIDNMDYAAWREAIEVNMIAPFRMVSAFRENLARASRPRVITISSQMGALNRKSKGAHAYRSSKAAVNKLMQVLALDLKDDDIIVCPVHPGYVRTDMGGPGADISAEESADGIFTLAQSLSMEQSGRFWTWQGDEHPW